MRLIDADALIAAINKSIFDADDKEWYLTLLANAPSFDFVRCKECKKAHLTYDGDCKYCDEWKDDDDNYIEVYHDGNHYCSYGERRESDE